MKHGTLQKRIACALLLAVLCLCGCENGKNTLPSGTLPGVTQTAPSGLVLNGDFVLTRPETPLCGEIQFCHQIQAALEESGTELSMTTDWTGRGEEVPPHEILVGRNDRPACETLYSTLQTGEWAVAVSGGSVLVAGNGGAALKEAVSRFLSACEAYRSDGVTVLPADYFEKGRVSMAVIDWTGADSADVYGGGGYPRLLSLPDGSLLCAFDGMYVASSPDGGMTWNPPVKASQSQFDRWATANASLIALENGDILLSYRAIGDDPGGFYTSLQVSVSHDGGKTWGFHSTICEHWGGGGYWEPCFGMIGDTLTVFYANDCIDQVAGGFQNIEFMQWDGSQWGNRTVVSDGEKHRSRDGMPTWCRLSDGSYVLVIEAWDTEGNGAMIVKLLTSPDGISWSEPVGIYVPSSGKAAAPYVVELPTGQLLVSFQTDEDMTEKGDGHSAMKTILSDGSPASLLTKDSFGTAQISFETPDGYCSIWNGLYISGKYVYAVSGASYPYYRVALRRFIL